METPRYTFTFGDLEKNTTVEVCDHDTGRRTSSQITLNDLPLAWGTSQSLPPVIMDLVDLSVAIWAADRWAYRHPDMTHQLEVILPLRCPEIFSGEDFRNQVQSLLYWYTGDDWVFDFRRRRMPGREVELQRSMFRNEPHPLGDSVALWSGGLDSAAGLYTELVREQGMVYSLFSLDNGALIGGTQRRIASELKWYFPKRVHLVQIAIRTSPNKQLTLNRRPRSRGLVFMLLGAAFAYLRGQRVLNVFENGVGALNLPFRRSEVGLDHARSVHPQSLRDVGSLVASVIDSSFSVTNPFLFWTKAQLCYDLVHSELAPLAIATVTCDSRHRQRDCPPQCGYCSSCLLRRQALTACGNDLTRYVVPHFRNGKTGDDAHLRAMLHQADKFRDMLGSLDWWRSFSAEYPSIVDTVECIAQCERMSLEEVKENLHKLYSCYAEEWNAAQEVVGRGLLDLTDATTGDEPGYDQREEADLWKAMSFNL